MAFLPSLHLPTCSVNVCLYLHPYLMITTFLVASIGFEETSYQVNERAGTMQLCAVVFEPSTICPIEFDFKITFATSDITAGT